MLRSKWMNKEISTQNILKAGNDENGDRITFGPCPQFVNDKAVRSNMLDRTRWLHDIGRDVMRWRLQRRITVVRLAGQLSAAGSWNKRTRHFWCRILYWLPIRLRC